jgi:hypothetical protein
MKYLIALLLLSCGPKSDPCTVEAKAAIIARAAPGMRECPKVGFCQATEDAKAELREICP